MAFYLLENQEYKTFNSNRQQGADDFTWHHRLGHASSKVFQHLSSSKATVLNKNNLPVVCEPCQMEKSLTREFGCPYFLGLSKKQINPNYKPYPVNFCL